MKTNLVGILIIFAVLCIAYGYGDQKLSSGEEEEEILRTVYEILKSNVDDDDGVKEQADDGYTLKLIERPENVKVDEGETVQFTVRLSGNPSPTVTWEKVGDAKWKINNQRIKVESKTNSWSLIITKVSKKDEGLYRCMVTQDNEVKMVYISELIIRDNQFVTFVEAPEDISVYEGKTATFTVKFSGSSSTVKWEKVNNPNWKIDDKRIQVKSNKNDTSWSLVIDKVEKKDAGQYKCIVTDISGAQVVYIKMLTVKDIPFLILNKRPEDVSVYEGKTAKFTVKLRGDPSPVVKWEKVGDPKWKIDDKKIQVQSEINDSWTLIINRVNENDEGLYKCTVTHESGDEFEFIRRLTIKDVIKPTHIKALEDVSVYEGETDTFTVKFSGSPSKVKWEKVGDSNWKIDNKRIQVQSEISDSRTLIINKVNENDEGLYKCTVTDESGLQFIYVRKLTVKALACKSNPCKNGGECHWLYDENDYECICPWPYEGKDCEYSKRVKNPEL